MKIRKAILTGGGRATRLHPITTTINKHLLPLGNKPMIFHAIEKVVEAGVRDIFINTNPGETELQQYVGDGGHWGVRIQFYEQAGGPQGLAHVVKEAERFIGGDPFLFYLSDNILLSSIAEMVRDFERGGADCMLALSQVPDPERFGVPVFDDGGKLVDVVEKPANPQSQYAVTGMYMYGPRVFFEAFDRIEKSNRGEYEISSIHSDFLRRGMRVGYKEVTGWWKDTGKHDDLLDANRLLLEHMEPDEFRIDGHIDAASVRGAVRVGAGTRIADDVTLEGPAIIGENCLLKACHIGPFATVGSGVEISGNARVEDSIVLDNAVIDCAFHIRKSIIGKNARIVQKKDEGARRLIIGDKTILEI